MAVPQQGQEDAENVSSESLVLHLLGVNGKKQAIPAQLFEE